VKLAAWIMLVLGMAFLVGAYFVVAAEPDFGVGAVLGVLLGLVGIGCCLAAVGIVIWLRRSRSGTGNAPGAA